jgi:hypothetical protein
MGWYRTKRPMTLRPFSVSHLSSNHSRFIHQSSMLWLQHTPSSEKGKRIWREITAEFWLSVFLSYLKGFLVCRKILWHGVDGFTSLLNEGVLRIFIALKHPLLLARCEPTNLGYNFKRVKYITRVCKNSVFRIGRTLSSCKRKVLCETESTQTMHFSGKWDLKFY